MTVPFGWLLQLAQAATRDQAQAICNRALADGVPAESVAAALAEWDEREAASVVTWTVTL